MKKSVLLVLTIYLLILSGCTGKTSGTTLNTVKDDIENSYYMANIDKEISMATMNPEEIYGVFVDGVTIDDSEGREGFSISMYPNEQALATMDYDGCAVVQDIPLKDDQVEKIRNLVADYNITVAEHTNEYWPHTEEYPPMKVLFSYHVTDKDKTYRNDGACCTPPGFASFMENLADIVTENAEEIGGKVFSNVSDETFLKYLYDENGYVNGINENESLWENEANSENNLLREYGQGTGWEFLNSFILRLIHLQWPEDNEEPCPYTPYDYNVHAVEYDISGQKYMAVCYENIKTDSGAFCLIKLCEDGNMYHCFGMPYSAKDICTIYDNGIIKAHITEEWGIEGDYYFNIPDTGIITPVDESAVNDCNELLLINEKSLADYIEIEKIESTNTAYSTDGSDNDKNIAASDITEYPYNFKFADVFGNEWETEILEFVPKTSYKAENFTFEDGRTYYEDDEYYTRQGIDVSNKQGNINWDKVKASGIDFVIIREGYRGYGKEGTLLEDARFKKNIEGAQKAGLDVGVYIFSQAINAEEAEEEADLVLTGLEGYELQLPVVYDPESILDAPARTDNVSGEQFTENTIVFCEKIKEAGYSPMVYSNMLWEAYEFDMEKLSTYGYPFWYADYEQLPQTPYAYDIWQYSCEGHVDGIDGVVDLDLQFVKK